MFDFFSPLLSRLLRAFLLPLHAVSDSRWLRLVLLHASHWRLLRGVLHTPLQHPRAPRHPCKSGLGGGSLWHHWCSYRTFQADLSLVPPQRWEEWLLFFILRNKAAALSGVQQKGGTLPVGRAGTDCCIDITRNVFWGLCDCTLPQFLKQKRK